jgi:tRNA(Ile)-lysidine synthase
LKIEFWEQGRLKDKKTAKSLKAWFQLQRIPPWQRQKWPLIWWDDRLVYIPGFYIDAGFSAEPNQQGWSLKWNPFNKGGGV